MSSKNIHLSRGAARPNAAFTIVELLIVVVVIAILAAITVVAYNGISARANRAALQADVRTVINQLEVAKVQNSEYPTDLSNIKKDDTYTYQYVRTTSPDSFCISVTDTSDSVYHVTNIQQTLQEGACDAHKIEPMIAVGNNHACAVIDNVLKCWGANGNGQVGIGTNTTPITSPTVVNASGALAGKTITKIVAGYNYTCALADGMPYCWGYYGYGTLGDNGEATADRRSPTKIYTDGALSGKQITDISAGSFSACVLADGMPYCWGQAQYGKIGNGATTGTYTAPTAVETHPNLTGKTLTGLTSGVDDNCVIANGAVYCWGRVATYSRSTPYAFAQGGSLTGKTVKQITSSASNVGHCLLATDSTAHCIGQGASGQLGNGSTATSSAPVAVTTSGDLSGKTIGWLVRLGGTNHCAVDTEGGLYCWGAGSNGVFGNGSTTGYTVPTLMTNSAVSQGKVQAASGNSNTLCVIVKDEPYCSGLGSHGILGNGATATTNTPVKVNW